MNTFWLKIAAAAVAVVVAIVLVAVLTSGPDSGPKEPPPPEKTFYDQAEKDKEKFLAEPKPLENQQQAPTPPQQPAENQTQAAPAQPAVEPPKPAEPTIIYAKELSEIDAIEAERLLNVAAPARSIGRLPVTSYKLMVDSCRQIIQRWPDSWYAYNAKRMLADIPQRDQQRYSVTKDELDMSRFAKPRPGTKPFTIKESR
jgi:type IV secretory pathway VirB10-like protein